MRRYRTDGRRILCWLLIAAMVLTGSAFSGLDVQAAQPAGDAVAATEEETTSAATEGSSAEKETGTQTGAEETASETETVVSEEELAAPINDEVQAESETEETATEEVVGKPVVDGATVSLTNGDFETNGASWSYEPWEVTKTNDADTAAIKKDGTNNSTYYLNLWASADTTMLVKQTNISVPAGTYKASLRAAGVSAAGDNTGLTLYVKNSTETLASVSFTALNAWDTWVEFSTAEFTLAEDAADISIEISGNLSSGEYVQLDDIVIADQNAADSTYTKEQLETLYNQYVESNYTAASWTESGMKTAMESAKTLIDSAEVTDENNASQITAAYEAITAAAEGLIWLDFDLYVKYETAPVLASWSSALYGTDFAAVDGRNGWYKSNIKIVGSALGSTATTDGFGFNLLSEADNWESKFFDTWGQEVFSTMLSGNSTTYYLTQTGSESEITWSLSTNADVMNTVSFNIYSADTVPCLVWKEGEETKSQPATADSGAWYTVTDFIVPETGFSICAGAADQTVMSAFTKDGAIEGSTVTGTLFTGYTWYLYKTNEDGTASGALYQSKNDLYAALGVTLENLSELIAEGETYLEKPALMYKEADLTALKSAIDTAKALTEAASTDSEAITNAYLALSSAIGNMAEQPADVTFYYYNASAENLGIALWNGAGSYVASTAKSAVYSLGVGGWETTVYTFTPVENYDGWFSIQLTLKPGVEKTSGFGIYSLDNSAATDTLAGNGTQVEGADGTGSLIASLISYESEVYLLNSGTIYKNFSEATLQVAYKKLSALYETIKDYEAVDKGTEVSGEKKKITFYTGKEWDTFAALRTTTAQLVAAGIVNLGDKTEAEVYNALVENYDAVSAAIDTLTPATLEAADVNVTRVSVNNEFITGADLSSYISLVESGVVFKDAEGNPLNDEEFFAAIKAGGTNWVRIRVWDDPYDSSGNGYGGGNNDIDKAITIGKLATNAGMRVLIDFHYSDFWVDPSKYDAPKAWEGMDINTKKETLYNYTYDNLVKLKEAGVDVGMVQVGNETNSGIAGETSEANMTALFSAGSRAVRDFSEKYMGNRNAVLVAVHFTDPQDGFSAVAEMLDRNGVDYDVFASSYYPMWHENATGEGDTSSLTTALEYVASTYNKKVMVAETSWPTTWEDGDGHDNSAPKTSGQNLQYDISVQGQINEMRAVVSAVNSVSNGIGVFYWEPAWIPVGYAYNDDGTLNEEQYRQNQALWEKYGSGWASSYSAEFDPEDAGLWYGGSAIDNQSWFDFDGTALPSLNTYRYIRNGAYTDLKISGVSRTMEMEVTVGDAINFPAAVEAKFNDGTTKEYPVVWNKEQKAAVSTDKTGEYSVNGVVTCTYQPAVDGAFVTEKYNVTLTIKVLPMASSNQLKNAGFETVEGGSAAADWTLKYRTKAADGTETESTTAPEGAAYSVLPTNENPRTGNYGMNFWRGDAGISIKVCQEITGLDAGTYDFGGYIQGGSAGEDDLSYSYVTIYTTDENGARKEKAAYRSSCTLSGWLNWGNPEVSGFEVEKGDILEVGFEINTSVAGSWGSIDDAYLYGSYGVNVDTELENGTITVSDTVATVGELVRFTVTPDNGYVVDDADIYLYTLNEDGTKKKVTDCALTVSNAEGSFLMPAYPIYITATMKSIADIANADTKEPGIDINEVKFEKVKTQIYTGKEIKPEITATYKNYTLVNNKDYTLVYSNNKETGTAKIEVSGKGNFKGKKTEPLTFEIKKATDLKDAAITVSGGDETDNKGIQLFCYTGEEILANVKVEVPGTEAGTMVTLTEGTDYILSYEKNKKVGTAAVYVVAKENNGVYTGSVKKTFKIVKADIKALDEEGKLTVSQPAGSIYSGKALKPTVTVKYGALTLKKGTDYTVTYKNNVNVVYDSVDKTKVETAGKVIIKGKGSFKGTIEKEFMISPKSLKDTNVTAKAETLSYTGRKLKPSVTVVAGGSTKLKLNKDYSIVKYEYRAAATEDYKQTDAAEVKEIGEYRLTLEGMKNYLSGEKGQITVTFKVTDPAYNIAKATVKAGKADFTGKAVQLDASAAADEKKGNGIKVYSKSGTLLEEGKEYTLVYDNNIKAGKKAMVTVKGKEGSEYAGEKTVNFTINQADISKLAEGSVTASPVLDDTLGATQYYTGYALTPGYKVTAVLSGNKVTMQKGTDYTIKFKDNVTGKKQADGTYLATAIITGKGNFKGTYTTDFEITPTRLEDFNISVKPVTYNGKAQKPEITFIHKATGVVFDLKAGTAYKASCKNNKDVGNAGSVKAPTVSITEKGLNAGATEKTTVTKNFTITNAKIQASDVADIKIQTYKAGKALTPKLTVKVNGRKLKLNTDYKVKYAENTLRGEAAVTVTGIGNYAGTVEKTFVIK